MKQPDAPTVCPQNRQQWRAWLLAHHAAHASVWLVYHKKQSATPTLTWSEAVDEALCVGWIDSTAQPIDADTYRQRFGPRQPRSGWSKVNKEKVQRLLAEGKMQPAGLAAIARAQQNGAWTLLDEVEALRPPADLVQAFAQHPAAHQRFQQWSRTARRTALLGLIMAKRPATRQQRIAAILAAAGGEEAALGEAGEVPAVGV